MRSSAQVEGLTFNINIYSLSILIVGKARAYSEVSIDSYGGIFSLHVYMEQKPT